MFDVHCYALIDEEEELITLQVMHLFSEDKDDPVFKEIYGLAEKKFTELYEKDNFKMLRFEIVEVKIIPVKTIDCSLFE